MASPSLHFEYDDIDIFIASSYTKRTNRSAWAAYILQDDQPDIHGEVIDLESNYAALLIGVIQTLNNLPMYKSIAVHSSTRNFLRGVNERLSVWVEKDWKYADPNTGESKPISNYEVHWQEIFRLKEERRIRFLYSDQLVSEYYCNLAKKLTKWLLSNPINSHYTCHVVFDSQ